MNVQLLHPGHFGGGDLNQRSFTVNLGVWLSYVPPYDDVSVRHNRSGQPLPTDSDCLFRTRLRDSSDDELWFHMSETGDDLAVPVLEATAYARDQALDWFTQRDQAHQHLRLIQSGTDVLAALGSPFHLFHVGMVARGAGNFDLAASALRHFLTQTEDFDDDSDARNQAVAALAEVTH